MQAKETQAETKKGEHLSRLLRKMQQPHTFDRTDLDNRHARRRAATIVRTLQKESEAHQMKEITYPPQDAPAFFERAPEIYEELVRSRLALDEEIANAAKLIDCEATKDAALLAVARAFTRETFASAEARQLVFMASAWLEQGKADEARARDAESKPAEEPPAEATPPSAALDFS